MYYVNAQPTADFRIVWQTHNSRLEDPKEEIKLCFHSSGPELLPRRAMHAFVEELVRKNELKWISPSEEKWGFSFDGLLRTIPELKEFPWLTGKTRIKPEYEQETLFRGFPGEQTQATLCFYFTPEEIADSAIEIENRTIQPIARYKEGHNQIIINLELIRDMQEQLQPFSRLLSEMAAQKRFIESIVTTPFEGMIREINKFSEQIRTLTEIPAMRVIAEMQANASSVLVNYHSWAENVLRRSLMHQTFIENLVATSLALNLEPLLQIEKPGLLEGPLYLLELPDDTDDQETSSPIIQVTAAVGPELVRYYNSNPDALRNIHRRKFEEFVAEIFAGLGFEVELTAQTRDGGKDIIAVKHKIVRVKYLIECKRPDPGNPVGVERVRALLGVKTTERATKGILATTTKFSPDAMKMFENHKWELEPRDFNGLQEWMRDYLDLKRTP